MYVNWATLALLLSPPLEINTVLSVNGLLNEIFVLTAPLQQEVIESQPFFSADSMYELAISYLVGYVWFKFRFSVHAFVEPTANDVVDCFE